MSAELIGILSVGVALAAVHMASIRSFREDMRRMRLEALEQRMENRMEALKQHMLPREGVLDGLREALFGRARERVPE